MRIVALLIVLLVSAVVSAHAQQIGADSLTLEKWNLKYGETTWGLQPKSVTQGRGYFTLVLGFEKDLTAAELMELREAFPSRELAEKKASSIPPSKGVAFYFFDRENVVVAKKTTMSALSEVTGVKGDAFRVEVPADSAINGAVRVELRSTKDAETKK